jgi:hypothetical protein
VEKIQELAIMLCMAARSTPLPAAAPVRAIEPIYPDETPVGAIILTRPLRELHAHLVDFKCPSLRLIIRAVKTIYSAIFTGNFYGTDLMVGLTNGAVCGWRKEMVPWLQIKTDRDNYILDYAVCLVFDPEKMKKIKYDKEIKLEIAYKDIKSCGSLNAQSIREYFMTRHSIKLADSDRPMTNQDLLNHQLFLHRTFITGRA